MLTAAQSALTTNEWFVSAGSPVIDTTAGTITLAATADKAGLSNIPVGPNVQLTLTATPTPATASATYVIDIDFWTAANGYISSSYQMSTSGPLTVTTPATTDHVSIILQGQDGQNVVIDTVNLKRPAPVHRVPGGYPGNAIETHQAFRPRPSFFWVTCSSTSSRARAASLSLIA